VTLNKREKMIALALGAIVLTYVGDFYVYEPYMAARATVQKQEHDASLKLAAANSLLKNRQRVGDNWKALLAAGLKTNASDAESVALHALTDWAESANVHIDSHKTDASVQVGDFQQMRLSITGSGSMASISGFLANIETSHLPLQVGDFHLSSKKPGTDDLSVQLTVNALIFSPVQATTKPAKKATGDTI